MSHLTLDARAILEYLNELGYRNITGEQLKEFMKDLYKLIKYEEQMEISFEHNHRYDQLHKHATLSSRAKQSPIPLDPSKPWSVELMRNANEHLKKKQRMEQQQKPKRKPLGEKNVQQKLFADDENAAAGATADTTPISSSSYSSEVMRRVTNFQESAEHSTAFRENAVIIDNLRQMFDKSLQVSIEKSSPKTKKDNKENRNKATSTYTLERKQAKLTLPAPAPAPATPPKRRMTAVERERTRTRSPSPAAGAAAAVVRRKLPNAGQVKPTNDVVACSSLLASVRIQQSQRRPRANDPVALYHYYQREWKHFRLQIPGESQHLEVRRQVRNKLLCSQDQRR